jgi:uncharacterized peroxidase-related enzyme
MMAYPEAAKHLNGLAEHLLRGPSSLTPWEREVIATFVSKGNDCYFCTNAHAATARHLLGQGNEVVDQALADPGRAPISEKLKGLLAIADKVRQGGRRVTDKEVARARHEGADDEAIHDTVLIAAAFCMFNRYVDGLATWAPRDQAAYDRTGKELAEGGYVNSIPQRPQ